MSAEAARHAALLLALDPHRLGGAWVRAAPGPARERWLALLRAALPAGTPVRRMPLAIPDARLLGGLDLAGTLAAGRPVAERGLLAEADGGIVLAAGAERLSPGTAARLAAVLDAGEVRTARDGLDLVHPARLALVALDEGAASDEAAPPVLTERLAFHLALDDPPADGPLPDMDAARARLAEVTAGEETIAALCATAAALGIASLRAPLLALAAARGAAALAGRQVVADEDAALAAGLVLAPRATVLPAEPEAEQPPPPPEPPPPSEQAEEDAPAPAPEELADLVLAAARAAIPPGLLAALQVRAQRRAAAAASGRAGKARQPARRGRPIGARAGALRGGARLDLIATLRAAAPWQAVRARGSGQRVAVRRDDFRIRRFRQRTATTAIFVVDASGSQALTRLAEAKGAVELLLADCYVRRDQVALIAFRGPGAELLLPPTASPARARRCLAGLPGGGATPLAAGIAAAATLAEAVRRRGAEPAVILLTDGRANIARDGTPGRPQAEADALAAASLLRESRTPALLIDTSPRPQEAARRLAEAMGARCVPLPRADARAMAGAAAELAGPRR